MEDPKEQERQPEDGSEERQELLWRLSEALDQPMAVLAIGWTLLLVADLAFPAHPLVRALNRLDLVLWAMFAAQFALELWVAPDKREYLRNHWLTALSVVLPTLRAVRILRTLRALRSLSFVSILLRTNRATRAAGDVFSRHRFGYLLSLVALVSLVGAAGVSFFEQDAPGSPLRDFGDALWWSATVITTINVGADPLSVEGRVLALLLRVFAMAVFGYVAASIASYFIGRQEESREERRSREAEQLREVMRRLDTIQRQLEQLQAERQEDRAA